MNNVAIILMAQGTASRWATDPRWRGTSLPEYKHMLEIGGTSILGRTLEMLAHFRQDNIHVVGPPEYKRLLGREVFSLAWPGPLVNGIAETSTLWGEAGTLYLLGDVIFSVRSLLAIIDNGKEIVFMGRNAPNPVTHKAASEMFGFRMQPSGYDEVYAVCRKLLGRGRPSDISGPRLWDLYGGLSDKACLIATTDYTDDIDSPQEVEHFWPALKAAALAEDQYWHISRAEEL